MRFWQKNMDKFLKIEELRQEGKTRKFAVYSAHTMDNLGVVYWRPGWRRYVMHHLEADWSCECEREMYCFLMKLMQDRKRVMEKEMTLEDWEKATKLGCPNLRFLNGKWLAINRDPCLICDFGSCHNKGCAYDEPKKLAIIRVE